MVTIASKRSIATLPPRMVNSAASVCYEGAGQ
jgi:hypothetical protein